MPGRLLEDDPRVARRRDVLQLVDRERLLGPGLLRVHDRALAGDGDRFLHGRHAQLRAHVGAEADRDLDPFLDDGLEAGELELHGVGADLKSRKLEGSALAGRGSKRLQQRRSGECYRHARQHGAGIVGDLSKDLARLRLGPRCRHTQHEAKRRKHGGQTQSHRLSSIDSLRGERCDQVAGKMPSLNTWMDSGTDTGTTRIC